MIKLLFNTIDTELKNIIDNIRRLEANDEKSAYIKTQIRPYQIHYLKNRKEKLQYFLSKWDSTPKTPILKTDLQESIAIANDIYIMLSRLIPKLENISESIETTYTEEIAIITIMASFSVIKQIVDILNEIKTSTRLELYTEKQKFNTVADKSINKLAQSFDKLLKISLQPLAKVSIDEDPSHISRLLYEGLYALISLTDDLDLKMQLEPKNKMVKNFNNIETDLQKQIKNIEKIQKQIVKIK